MKTGVGRPGDAARADEDYRFFRVHNIRDHPVHSFLLLWRFHRIGMGGDGAGEMHLEIAAIGLDIDNNGFVLGEPIPENFGGDVLCGSNVR